MSRCCLLLTVTVLRSQSRRAGAGRGVGKLVIGALRAPREAHVDLSGGLLPRGHAQGPHRHAMGLEQRRPPNMP